jgi:hypothetical protein
LYGYFAEYLFIKQTQMIFLISFIFTTLFFAWLAMEYRRILKRHMVSCSKFMIEHHPKEAAGLQWFINHADLKDHI